MIKIFIFTLFLLLVSGCTPISKFINEPVTAFGKKYSDSNNTIRYFLLRVEMDKYPDQSLPSIQVQLSPDTAPIPLNKLTADITSRYLPIFTPPSQWPQHWKERAMMNPSFEGNGIYISFKNNQLNYLGICSNCGGQLNSPKIGKVGGSCLYPMPLTKRQMIEIFGPPRRLYDVREVTY